LCCKLFVIIILLPNYYFVLTKEEIRLRIKSTWSSRLLKYSLDFFADMKLEFGVRIPVSGPLASSESIYAIAKKAEELGFGALTTHDHVSFSYNERYHTSGGMAEMVDERDKGGLPVTNFYENIVTLAYLAGRVPRVRLVPCSLVLPIRYPVLLAKQIITFNELTGGRFVCCVCIGNIPSDFTAMNLNYKLKGKMMNEYLEVLKLIFNSQDRETKFEGRFVNFGPTEFYPKPSKKIPIWVAGSFNEKAYERVTRFADGFLPAGHIEQIKKGLPQLDDYMRARGRSIKNLDISAQNFMCLMKNSAEANKRARYTVESFFFGMDTGFGEKRDAAIQGALKSALVGSPDEVIKKLDEYVSAGIKFLDIRQVNKGLVEILEQLELFSKEVMPSF
jgi:alkanesulfonate monooxygenase SsuD/methylene tetrahydromethanopterin reductase-like flavin-dependent oxidoreductase (luciferase family)